MTLVFSFISTAESPLLWRWPLWVTRASLKKCWHEKMKGRTQPRTGGLFFTGYYSFIGGSRFSCKLNMNHMLTTWTMCIIHMWTHIRSIELNPRHINKDDIWNNFIAKANSWINRPFYPDFAHAAWAMLLK